MRDEPIVAMPTEEMLEISRRITRRKKREARIQYLKGHWIALASLLIALIALIVSIISLFAAKHVLFVVVNQSAEDESNPYAIETDKS